MFALPVPGGVNLGGFMYLRAAVGVVLLAGAAQQAAYAQYQVMPVPIGGTGGPPVAQQPPADPEDTPEEIAKDAARDLKDTRFYNKPGATRAEYDADWQTCRLIARGSRTPSGTATYVYNPAYVSPMAAGIGAGLGGLIGSAIVEGEQRRANRRSCLLIKGWRLVELPAADSTRLAAMADAERSAFFDRMVGAETVEGKITARDGFTQADDPSLKLDAPLAGPGVVWTGKKVDPAAPVALGEGEGAVVFGFRRVDAPSLGRSASVQFYRYDVEKRDIVYRPRDAKKTGDTTTYILDVKSADKKAGYEVQVHRITAGDYVINAMTPPGQPGLPFSTNCFGAPTFHVGKGEVVYVGDFVPYINARLSSGARYDGLNHTSFPDDARQTLAASQPVLAEAMKPAVLRNGATYACAGQMMTRWDLAGVERLPDPTPAAPADTAAEEAVSGQPAEATPAPVAAPSSETQAEPSEAAPVL